MNDKPLPRPASTPFTRTRNSEQDQEPLTADRMAEALAQGTLDEFLTKEMPDNEAARKLATMMMGMTGMMPMGGMPAPPPPAPEQQPLSAEVNAAEEVTPHGEVPEDVKNAIESGDVNSLKNLLRREYLKRTPGATINLSEEAVAPPPQASGMPAIDKDLVDAMIQIAKDNSVTMDWMILRAIKVYVEEYRKTGKL